MKARTTGAIALGPSGNLQGGVRFYSLTTGKILHRTKEDYNRMKMPVDAIRRIKYICKQKKSVPGLTFSDRNNTDDVITGVNEGQQEETNPETETYDPYQIVVDGNNDDNDDDRDDNPNTTPGSAVVE